MSPHRAAEFVQDELNKIADNQEIEHIEFQDLPRLYSMFRRLVRELAAKTVVSLLKEMAQKKCVRCYSKLIIY